MVVRQGLPWPTGHLSPGPRRRTRTPARAVPGLLEAYPMFTQPGKTITWANSRRPPPSLRGAGFHQVTHPTSAGPSCASIQVSVVGGLGLPVVVGVKSQAQVSRSGLGSGPAGLGAGVPPALGAEPGTGPGRDRGELGAISNLLRGARRNAAGAPESSPRALTETCDPSAANTSRGQRSLKIVVGAGVGQRRGIGPGDRPRPRLDRRPAGTGGSPHGISVCRSATLARHRSPPTRRAGQHALHPRQGPRDPLVRPTTP